MSVGDGAQLQPVEAGHAFRLVTSRLGKAELNTVLRQKEEWQKEATVFFGQQKTIDAIQKYADKGCIHIIEEKLPSPKEVIKNEDYGELVRLYEVSHRVSSLIYREMAKEVQEKNPDLTNLYPLIKEHQDFRRYLSWKAIEKESAEHILQKSEHCKSILEERSVDSFPIAMLFGDKSKPKADQHEEAKALLKKHDLDHLMGIEKKRGQTVDVREMTKGDLIQSWHSAFKACPPTFSGAGSRAQDPGDSPEKSFIMLAYSNKDVNDLNRSARSLLKESGHIEREEITFKTRREIEDDFGRKHTLKEEKGFSKGDKIVFTRNTYGLGVKNGTIGTITDLAPQKVHVKLDKGKEHSFSPKLNPYFD